MKRFRVYLTSCPEPGAKLLIHPGGVVDEWEANAGMARPEPAPNDKPRVGYVVRIIGQVPTHWGNLPTNDAHGGLWHVIMEDPPPFSATVGALLTVMLGPVLAPGPEILALLDWAVGREPDPDLSEDEPLTQEQYAAVADALREHLSEGYHLPRALRDAVEWIGSNLPRFDTEDEYAAWVLGVAVATGTHYGVVLNRPPDIEVPPAPEPEPDITSTRTHALRPEAVERIIRDRSN